MMSRFVIIGAVLLTMVSTRRDERPTDNPECRWRIRRARATSPAVDQCEPVGSLRTAWVTAVVKAHAVAPVWKSYNWTVLTPECHAEFRCVDLRWHELENL